MITVVAILLALLVAGMSAAQTSSPDTSRFSIEYVTGDHVWECRRPPCLGFLVIDPEQIQILDDDVKHPKVIFTIPLATITKVTNKIEKRNEYVSITTRDAEVLVFKVPAKTSPALAAKIVAASPLSAGASAQEAQAFGVNYILTATEAQTLGLNGKQLEFAG